MNPPSRSVASPVRRSPDDAGRAALGRELGLDATDGGGGDRHVDGEEDEGRRVDEGGAGQPLAHRAREVAQGRGLARRLINVLVRRQLQRGFDDFLDTAITRWKRSGAVAAMTNPDLKNGRGGLRDIQLLRALALGNLCDLPVLEEERRLAYVGITRARHRRPIPAHRRQTVIQTIAVDGCFGYAMSAVLPGVFFVKRRIFVGSMAATLGSTVLGPTPFGASRLHAQTAPAPAPAPG